MGDCPARATYSRERRGRACERWDYPRWSYGDRAAGPTANYLSVTLGDQRLRTGRDWFESILQE